ncbi:hypothetical protein [Propionivibrio sp.]|uniref:hypothetical protein n=1 Tax=Propionivibrio sp. TaxID=2212460 RepID=UPI003BF3A27F
MGFYIENDGALYRTLGGMTENPDDIYKPGTGWIEYKGDLPKPPGWGERILVKDAEAMMARMDASFKDRDAPAAKPE